MKDSFVYRWRSTRGLWYIGYHRGSVDDGYICSSVGARPQIQQDPSNWTRKILRTGTRSEMMALEHRLLTKLNARDNPRSLNRSNGFPSRPIESKKPIKIKVTGSTGVIYQVQSELDQALEKISGNNYYYHLLEQFFQAIKNRESCQVKEYLPLIEKITGLKLEMQ